MPELSAFELIGYLASVLVAISLMMVRIVRLRILNLCGALGFVLYGWLIGAWPVVLMNAFMVGVNCYHLWRLRQKKEAFSVISVPADDPYLLAMLTHFAADIQALQPHYKSGAVAIDVARLVLRNGRPSGLLLGQLDADKRVLRIVLDYALPEYQDFATGRFLYAALPQAIGINGVVAVTIRPSHPRHAKYLEKMGFSAEPDGKSWKRELGGC